MSLIFRKIISRLLNIKATQNVLRRSFSKFVDKIISMQNMQLSESDPDLVALLVAEEERQRTGLELIASENFTSKAVIEALGTCLTNKYVEGYPGKRYYGGCEVVDKVEELTIKRALEAFNLSEEKWGVNVQCFSGSPANFAVYNGLVGAGGRIMGLALADGGHLTHGYSTAAKKVSASSEYFESVQYNVDKRTGLIDMNQVEMLAKAFRPKIIVMGASSYPRDFDYQNFKRIARECGAILMCDMAHTSGLIASGLLKNPFDYCDVITTTTHKTMRGPRGSLIFSRKDVRSPKSPNVSLSEAINQSVFPGLQGGAHMNVIGAIGVALKELKSKEFKVYAKQIILNSIRLVNSLKEKGYEFVTDGTDNHLSVMYLNTGAGLDGAKVSFLCERAAISLNKNAVPGDTRVLRPSGIRIGTAALTSRGFKECHMEEVAQLLDEAIRLALKVERAGGISEGQATTTSIEHFQNLCQSSFQSEISNLRLKVNTLASKFELPAFEKNECPS